jgi:hypothetical protein
MHLQDSTSALASVTADAVNNLHDAQARMKAGHDKRRMHAAQDALPDTNTLVLVRRKRGDKLTQRADGPFLLVAYNQSPHTLALLQDADGRQWTEATHLLAPFRPLAQACSPQPPPKRPCR